MKKIIHTATALALAIGCALPVMAQDTKAPSGSSPASGISDATVASSDGGTPVTPGAAPGTPAQMAGTAPDPALSSTYPAAPAIPVDAAGTSTPPTAPNTQALGAGPDNNMADDRGGDRDIGWLGLLGLLGLLGMRRKHHDDDRVRTVHTR